MTGTPSYAKADCKKCSGTGYCLSPSETISVLCPDCLRGYEFERPRAGWVEYRKSDQYWKNYNQLIQTFIRQKAMTEKAVERLERRNTDS